MRYVTIKQALERAARMKIDENTDMLALPVCDLVALTLYETANNPGRDDRGASRANFARRMIFDRMVGTRRTGSHPAVRAANALEIKDLGGAG